MQACMDLNLSEEEFNHLVTNAKDWNIYNGCTMRSKENYNEDQAELCPFLLLPTPFPEKEYQKALGLQKKINQLMYLVAHDHLFLTFALENTIEVDHFTKKLFNIYKIVQAEGFMPKISLALIRSDYMLDSKDENKIKQVEVNMISSSFAGLSRINARYHRYILKQLGASESKLSKLALNYSLDGFSSGLRNAWLLYENKKAVILFIVEDVVYNVFDQRAIEFHICFHLDVKVIRRTFSELTTKAKLGPNKELLVDGYEVAVAYYRTGYQMEAYPTEKEWDLRLLIERSKAIKCPTIQQQLVGTKKVQQQLAVPGVLERFATFPFNVEEMRQVFMGLYSLDTDDNGDENIAMAMRDPSKFVLKPQREGGGNNFYGDDIKTKLEAIKDSNERSGYILMERIYPPIQKNYLIRPGKNEMKLQDFVSELGIYGIILADPIRTHINAEVGHILRTKPASDNEGGIVCGAGALDNPYLID